MKSLSLLSVSCLIIAANAFLIPGGVAPGSGNSWIYFGRGLSQKEIIDKVSEIHTTAESTVGTTPTVPPTTTTTTTEPTPTTEATTATEKVKIEETTAKVVEPVAAVKYILTTSAPKVEEASSTTVSASTPEASTTSTVEEIRGLPEAVKQTTEKPAESTTAVKVPESTTAETPATTAAPMKVKIVVIPKETTPKSVPTTTELPSTLAVTESTTLGETTVKVEKPDVESSSSSEESTYLKPDLPNMLRRVYRGKGPLHF